MQLGRLKKQLIIDLGKLARITTTTEGLSVGIGHKITKDDPEWLISKKPGDILSAHQIETIFGLDIAIAVTDSTTVFEPIWDELSSPQQEAIVNLMFSIKREEFLKLPMFIHAIYEKKWEDAGVSLRLSSWGMKNSKRAIRLSNMLKRLE